jgi:hypothetical protein
VRSEFEFKILVTTEDVSIYFSTYFIMNESCNFTENSY